MAIVVDTVAIPYIGYMTWDEYTGKPLGLRPPTQKISLILMDLFFIIFKSVSTTLAFETLLYHPSVHADVNRYSRALAAFLTVGTRLRGHLLYRQCLQVGPEIRRRGGGMRQFLLPSWADMCRIENTRGPGAYGS